MIEALMAPIETPESQLGSHPAALSA